jgi:hypothetical protein
MARRLRALPEVEHVAFGHEPIAETNAARDQGRAVGRDQVAPAHLHERLRGRASLRPCGAVRLQ